MTEAEKYANNSMKEWHGMSYIGTEFAEIKIKQAWQSGYEQGIRADVHKLGDERMNEEDKGIYMFVVKPYTIQNDEGQDIVIDGDIYVGMMPKAEAVTAAWLSDGECLGTVKIEPEQVATSFSRIVRIA